MFATKSSRSKKFVITVFIVLISVLGMQTSSADYYPRGIQQNVPIQTLIDNGWSLHYSKTFNTPISENVSELIPSGKYVILAAKTATGSTLILAAASLTSEVFIETPVNTPQLLNGTYWYYTKNPVPSSTLNVGSIGFAPTATINQIESDDFNLGDPLRLSCFTNFSLAGCFRLGTFQLLMSTEYLQQIWTRDADPVIAPAAPTLRQTSNLSFDQSQYGSDTLSDPDGQLRKTLDSINAKYGNLIK